jgi:ubiquinone/menaquinone biosynthesis C-methylase UbiE
MNLTNTAQWKFEGTPEAYETYLAPLLGLWTDELIGLAEVRTGERVLDVACGTGIVARRIAPVAGGSGKVVGLDMDPGMLRVASSSSAQVRPKIEWREANVNSIPFPDGSFEVAFCQHGLQFFPDKLAALKEIRRVLTPGGRIALNVWRPLHNNPGYAALAESLERRVNPESAQVMQGPFFPGNVKTLREHLSAAGFSSIHIRIAIKGVRFPSVEEFLRREVVSWLAGVTGELDDSTRSALIADLHRDLADNLDDEGLAFPMETYLTVARA